MNNVAGSTITRATCGERRCFYSWRIHEALAWRGTSSAGLARELGISTAAMSRTITGKSHSPRILDALRDMGVPEKYLFDPRRMAGDEPEKSKRENDHGLH